MFQLLSFVLVFNDALAQSKASESAQYLPPQVETTSAAWVGSEIDAESSLVVFPSNIPTNICNVQYRCLRRIYLKVELSTGGIQDRLLRTGDD